MHTARLENIHASVLVATDDTLKGLGLSKFERTERGTLLYDLFRDAFDVTYSPAPWTDRYL